jgi:CheY-like chemotaxis protein
MQASDVEEYLGRVRKWAEANNVKIILYSGGATGDNGIYQRSEVRRKLEDFIVRVKNNDQNPMEAFNDKKPLRSLIQWLNVYQHDFGNLYAPLDYLALLYQGGDISEHQYQKIKEELKAIVSENLAQKTYTNKGLGDVFKQGEISFNDVKSVNFSANADSIPLKKFVSFPIIHIDDDIANGWNSIFSTVFGKHYIYKSTPKEGLREISKYAHSNCVVFLDLRMPNKVGNKPSKATGFEALRTIRKKWPLLPVFIFSADTDYTSYGNAIKQGASGYFVKYVRSLETRTDNALYLEFWKNMRTVRIANIKHCIGYAFNSILTHRNFENFSTEDNRFITKMAIQELSHSLQLVFFDRIAMEDDQAISNAGYLIILLYKTIEHYVKKPFDNSNHASPITTQDPLISVTKKFRNYLAHSNFQEDEEQVWPGIREILLSASTLIARWGALLQDEEWARSHLDSLEKLLIINRIDQGELREKLSGISSISKSHENPEYINTICDFLTNTMPSRRHRITEILAIDCCYSKTLHDGSYFSWLSKDDYCPIHFSQVRLKSIPIISDDSYL